MSRTLYIKYRPTTFAEVIDQNHIKLTLQNEIELGNITHAYLFAGPRGIGKTTLARLFAKIVNCENLAQTKNEPCNQCPSCQNINSGRSLDVIEIDAASQTGVDNVRENIIENVRFTPHAAKYKVFIIDEVHMLSLSAFNALLKTLEEPPEHAIFILCTTELYKLPETIISRCQRFDFKKIPSKDMINKLKYVVQQEGIKVDDEVIRAVARKADGFMRDAESLLGQVLALGEKDIHMEDVSLILPRIDYKQAAVLIGYILDKNADQALDVVNNLVNEGIDVERFNQDIIEYLRKLILAQISTQDEVDFSEDMGEEIENLVFKQIKQTNLEQLITIINNFIQRQTEFKNTHIVQLPLELAIVELIGETRDTKSQNHKITKSQNHLSASTCADRQADKITKTQSVETPHQGNINDDGKTNKFNRTETSQDADRASQSPKQTQEDDNNRTIEPACAGRQLNNDIGEPNATNKSPESKPKINIPIDTIKQKWPHVVEASKKYNHALQFILKIAYPIKIKDYFLILGFEYPFHKERISDTKNKDLVDKVLQEVFNQPIIFKTHIVEGDKLSMLKKERHNAGVDEEKVLNDVLEAFDGKLME